ncbi:lipopolysaccharide assembly protein LapB [Exiguobacterium sp. s80]|uniref:tetratricopeptide repeat protein n=1 Tax=Exiguobacterium sp. s80 TaxID=2751209 RepID=UPI001BEBDDF7|nr:hypothetical protein [Exiguobacterium sp. s80]
MGTIELSTLIKMFGSRFFSFMLPKVKNSKYFRDLQEKWRRDNYAEKTTMMFKAAVDDAKSSIELPDELVFRLLDDPINREEVFRWILKNTSDDFDEKNLNFEPYIENFPRYQDLIKPFFEVIFLSLYDYKEKHWDPEFLEIINKIDGLEEKLETINFTQKMTLDVTKENNLLLQEILTPVEFSDLNDLMKLGKVVSTREKALERLKKPNLKRSEIMQLNLIIANTYIESRNNEYAVEYLYTAITNCDSEPKRNRLKAVIYLFQKNFEQANKFIKEAIKVDGFSNESLNIQINIFIEQGKINEAHQLLVNNPKVEFNLLRANVLLNLNNFDETIEMANKMLKTDPLNVEWLITKAEAFILKFEYDIESNNIFNSEKNINIVMPILEKIESENSAITDRVKELKASLLFRNSQYSEAKVLLEEIFKSKKNFSSTLFNNLLLNCLYSNDWGKAINLLQEKQLTEELSQFDILTLADVYIRTGKGEKAIELLEANEPSFYEKIKFPYNYYFSYINALISLLKHQEIKSLFKDLEEKEISTESLNILKGFYSYKNHEWDNVVKYMEPTIERLEKDELLECQNCLTTAYINLGTKENLVKLKKIILSITHWVQFEFLSDRYVEALYKLGEYKSIIELEKKISSKSIFFLNIVALIYYRTHWYETAQKRYLSLYQRSGSLDHLLRYANCLYRSGDINECVEILFSAELKVKKSGEIEDYQLLSSAFFDAKEYRKSMEFAFLAFLYENDNPEIWKFFFIRMTELIELVDNPEKEWMDEYKNVTSNFQKKFPNEQSFFKSFTLSEEGTLPDELLAEVLKSDDLISHIKTTLTKQRFPISVIVNLMNKGPFESWGHVVNENSTYLWITDGTVNHLKKGTATALFSGDILCDFTTLLTLQNLSLLETLNENFHLFIHQQQFDLAFQEYTKNKTYLEKGLKLLSRNNEGLKLIEYTSDQIKDTLKYQEQLMNWIKNNCTFIGNEIDDHYNENLLSDNLNFLNNPLKICKEKNLTMLVDSLLTQEYAEQEFGLNCFSSLDFVNFLSITNKIDNERKNEYLGKFLMMGYAFIPVKAEVLIHFLNKNDFEISQEISTLFNYFKLDGINENYLNKLFGELLYEVWIIKDISTPKKHTLTKFIIDSLKNKDINCLQKLIYQSKSYFDNTSEKQWVKMKEFILHFIKEE